MAYKYNAQAAEEGRTTRAHTHMYTTQVRIVYELFPLHPPTADYSFKCIRAARDAGIDRDIYKKKEIPVKALEQ